MRAFVSGSTGLIGGAVARALRRAGHRVTGLVRRHEQLRGLERDEIMPVIGDMADPQGHAQALREASLIVHCAAAPEDRQLQLERDYLAAVLRLARDAPQPRTLIYTSGVWVYGNSGEQLVDESSPLDPPRRVAARPDLERMVLEAEQVWGIVLRPGCVYGGGGGLTAMWCPQPGHESELRTIGNGSNHWAMVHVDDLAAGYVLAAHSGLGGELFNLVDGSRHTQRQLAEAAGRAVGVLTLGSTPVFEAEAELGDLAGCLALDQNVDGRKAMRVLGWQPQRRGFVEEADVYLAAVRARREA